MPEPMVIAVPKGRILKELIPRFAQAGIDVSPLQEDNRRLVREGSNVRFLLLKPDDVPTYVEYGVADLGVVGRDVLLERDLDVFAPVDLRIGACRMVVAGVAGTEINRGRGHRPLRVATEFTGCATRHFEEKGMHIEPIFVQGSVELAPLTGLSDVIVNLVQSGETLRQNNLVVLEELFPVTSLLVANRVGLKLKRAMISPIIEALEASVGG